MVKEFIFGKMATDIKESIKMIYEMDMELCIGTTALYIKDSGKMEYKMEKAYYL